MVVLCHFCVYKFRKLLYRFKKGSILIPIKGQTGLLVGRAKKSQISLDFQGQIRGKNGRFHGKFAGFSRPISRKMISKKNGRFRWKAIGFALI